MCDTNPSCKRPVLRPTCRPQPSLLQRLNCTACNRLFFFFIGFTAAYIYENIKEKEREEANKDPKQKEKEKKEKEKKEKERKDKEEKERKEREKKAKQDKEKKK